MSNMFFEPDALWYKDAVIYELHVKAFFDSNNDGIGDFPGLIQKLDYLKELGVTCIWLLPFYPSPLRDDGYDIADYHGVNAAYGTRRDFRRLVREAHRRGMRVITELVINHTSDQHPWFQAARQAPAGSSKRDFYVWSDSDQKYRDARIIFTDSEKSNWSWDPVAQAYYWHRFFHHQPDLNFRHPRVKRAVLRVMRFWFDMGVDGMRLDAVPYLFEREGTNCENLPETHELLKWLRKELDANYRDRMFLAEANQWPDAVRPYFGDGDECHMAYNFPLMPRIFMALRQEDRHPITEIMGQMPDIPASCQWALFLRNHDELTLEMVTDEERDYMYHEYAADPRMRLNLGIRRRLAPLVSNSRRRFELLNSLLFSFPGTPIVYYGDEIGMGDNVYLGDRDGVRTPMQWTGDRNAGFSRANPAKLYSAPIMDALYGYQAVNVEAQQEDPSSMLNWMKRLIALRKQHHTFSRGTIEFLRPENRKVLCYARCYEGNTILCVANLSRFVQPAQLELAQFTGYTPVEMFGKSEFPAIGDAPYFLSLGPHSFFWFLLRAAAPSPTIFAPPAAAEPSQTLVTIHVEGPWENLLQGAAGGQLQGDVLPQYISRQRWYGAKARRLEAVGIMDWALLGDGAPPSFLMLVRIDYDEGGEDLYFLPVAISTGPDAEKLVEKFPGAILARVTGPAGDGVLHDAMASDGFCLELLAAIEQRRELATKNGLIQALSTSYLGQQRGSAEASREVARGSAEQSNTSVRFGNQLILKVFRRLQPGPNPDFEIGRFLTEKARFDRVPPLAGGFEYHRPYSEPIVLGMLQGLVNNEGDGWQHALNELRWFFERAATAEAPPQVIAAGLMELCKSEQPPEVAEAIGSYLQAAARLGARTAELHLALCQHRQDPDFAPEPLTAADLVAVVASAQEQAAKALSVLAEKLDSLSSQVVGQARTLLQSRSRIERHLADFATMDVTASKMRCHGDYHLGQVLWTENDFVILDFEGEPARPLAERRAKQSPLKDVAGMLRSFGYAAYAGLFDFTHDRPQEFERLEPWAAFWESWTSASFLRQYLATAADADFIPAEPDHLASLLQLFLLDKALYELLYELNSRPGWVRIPLHGILGLLELPREDSSASDSSALTSGQSG